jgi:hypothetical protein
VIQGRVFGRAKLISERRQIENDDAESYETPRSNLAPQYGTEAFPTPARPSPPGGPTLIAYCARRYAPRKFCESLVLYVRCEPSPDDNVFAHELFAAKSTKWQSFLSDHRHSFWCGECQFRDS